MRGAADVRGGELAAASLWMNASCCGSAGLIRQPLKSCVRSSPSLVFFFSLSLSLSLCLPVRFPGGQPAVSINLAIMTVMAAACRGNNVAETFNHAKFRDSCLQKSGRLFHSISTIYASPHEFLFVMPLSWLWLLH